MARLKKTEEQAEDYVIDITIGDKTISGKGKSLTAILEKLPLNDTRGIGVLTAQCGDKRASMLMSPRFLRKINLVKGYREVCAKRIGLLFK